MKKTENRKREVVNRILTVFAFLCLLVSVILFIYPYSADRYVFSGGSDSNDNETYVSGTNGKNTETAKTEDTTESDSGGSEEYSQLPGYISGFIADSGEIDKEGLLSEVRRYNESIRYNQHFENGFENEAIDLRRFNMGELFGYITIPRIDIYVPVYLGASNENMQKGATHLCWTSLPDAYEGDNNTVLCGHTGYTGMFVFDRLTDLKEGDQVTVFCPYGRYMYRVESQKVTGPVAGDETYIQKGKNLLTLVTCSDNGKKRLITVCSFTKKKEI